jgi:hypothetical protein
MSTGLSRLPEHIVEDRAEALRQAFYPLMEDEEFIKSVTYGPNDVKKVRYRFAVASAMFHEVFDVNPA